MENLEREAKMTVDEFIASLTVGRPDTEGYLTVFPVFAGEVIDEGFMLLEEALKTEKVAVQEVSEGGSVPNLYVENGFTDLDLLLLQGDILMGAKQNRTVNASIIVPHASSLKIPVSCVEQGRWSYNSQRFSSGKSHLYASLRKKSAEAVSRNLKSSEGMSYDADQGEVWNDIREKFTRMETVSETQAMEDIYLQNEACISDYEKAFSPLPGQVGFIAAIGGKITGLEVFGSQSVLPKVYGKLLKGYILDAIDQQKSEETNDLKKKPGFKGTARAEKFITKTASMKRTKYKSIGTGDEIRLENGKSSGFALVNEKDEVVHMAVFA